MNNQSQRAGEGGRVAEVRRELLRRAGMTPDERVAFEAAQWVVQIEQEAAARDADQAQAVAQGRREAGEDVARAIEALADEFDGDAGCCEGHAERLRNLAREVTGGGT